MADVVTQAKRSEVLSRIRSRGKKDTELALAWVLRANGIIGWRRQLRIAVDSSKLIVDSRKGRGKSYQPSTRSYQLTVRPDFVFFKSRTAVFVDGCFWPGCPEHATKPKGNRWFWRKKLSGNQRRNLLVTRTLRWSGWRVIRIWDARSEQMRSPEIGLRNAGIRAADSAGAITTKHTKHTKKTGLNAPEGRARHSERAVRLV